MSHRESFVLDQREIFVDRRTRKQGSKIKSKSLSDVKFCNYCVGDVMVDGFILSKQ